MNSPELENQNTNVSSSGSTGQISKAGIVTAGLVIAAVVGCMTLSGQNNKAVPAQTKVTQNDTKAQEEQISQEEENILKAVHIGEYKNLPLEIEVPTVTEDEIQTEIDYLIKDAGGVYADSKSPVTETSRVIADRVALNPETNEPNTETLTEDVKIDMDGDVDETIKQSLLGKNIGDIAEATVTESIFGLVDTTNTYQLTIKKILEPSDKITDEFVKELKIDDVATVDELHKSIEDYLTNYMNDQIEKKAKLQLLDKAIENTQFDSLPQELNTQYAQSLYAQAQGGADYRNAHPSEEELNLDEKDRKKWTADDILNEQKEADGFVGSLYEYVARLSEAGIKENLTVIQIAKAEGIEAEQEKIYSLAASDWKDHLEEYPTLLEFLAQNGTGSYEIAVLKEDVMDMLYDNANITKIQEEAPSKTSSKTEQDKETAKESQAEDVQDTSAQKDSAVTTSQETETVQDTNAQGKAGDASQIAEDTTENTEKPADNTNP